MPKTFIKKTGGWTEIRSIFVKKTTGWTEVKNVFIKKVVSGAAAWVKVFTKLSLPDTTTSPSIRTTNTGSGSIYDGPVATSPQFLNENLYGKDGVYTNYTSIFGRKFTSGDTSSALTRSTVVTGDLFTSGGGVTTTDRTNLDNKYLFYELTVQNGSSANEIYPISPAIKMIKSYPALTDMGWTGAEQVGTQLSLSYTIENYYYNKIDPALSYVRWWRSSSTNAGGTLLQEQTITSTSTGATSTSRTGTSLYTPVSADIGYYIVAEITGRSSYTDHYGYTDNYAMGSFPTDGVIGSALLISNVSFTDSNGRSGKNARGNLVTATTTNLNWTVTGVNVNTTFRVRYRILNNQTSLYYNPNDPTTSLAAGSAWLSYTDDYNGTGTISSVSISGSTATLYDVFTIDETFNGSTYGGGISRWSFQYELSVVNSSGTRTYWVYPSGMSTSQTNDYWDIDPTTNPSISASPSTIAPGGTVTFSGTFNSYPAGLNSYPHSYKIVYGNNTDSGWITLSSSPANQTYSNTKTYNTAGSYSAYVETTPSYTTNSASVTVANIVSQNTAPTTRATSTFSASTVKYLDSITWTTGSYTNAASITSVLLYSTVTSNLVSPGGNTLSSFRTANPYAIVPSDPAGTPYVFAVRDTVVGINGTTYYFYSNQITSANADAVAFSYGSATSTAGGWTASVNAGTQSGATYSYVSATAGSGSVNSSTGAITASGLTSNQSSTITVNKSVSGYNTTSITASGQSGVVATVPTAPTSVFANNITSSGVRINWSAPSSNGGAAITSYEINRNGGGFFSVGNVTFYDYFISVAGSNTIGVRAVNSAGAGPAAFVTVTIPAAFVAPTSPAPSWTSGSNFQRITGSSILRWYTDYPSISGDGSITGMQFEIRTTAGGGTLLASGQRAYPGAGTYPYSGGGTIWAFRCGTSDGDISYSASARFARARVVMLGTNGTTYFGTYSGWI